MCLRFLRKLESKGEKYGATGPQASCLQRRVFQRRKAVGIRQYKRFSCFALVKAGMPAVRSVVVMPALVSIVIVFLLTLTGCSHTELIAIPQKHYIEPPKQKKIPASTTALRVCADPNNMPFSNKNGDGFENKIADVIAGEMHLPIEYTWWAQRRGFFRSTLRAGICDVVIGVPESFELAATTRSYYRSTYVFVSRRDRNLNVRSFDDPALRDLKIGVQLVGDDGANTPPVHALNNRGIVENLKGYTLYGDYKDDSPPARVLDAVEKGDVDVAVVWGPLAGNYARQHRDLVIQPVSPQIDLPYLPFVYDISVGVRRGEDELRTRIDEILERRHDDIRAILDRFNVPQAPSNAVAAEVKQ